MSTTSNADLTPAEREKKAAAEASVELVENGMMVGLGTGSTVAFLLPALARRGLSIRCVATSPRTDKAGRELGFGDGTVRRGASGSTSPSTGRTRWPRTVG